MDFPDSITITEEGPREGFQIEAGPIPTADKIALIDELSQTGVPIIQACSFVSPRLVPGWADADDVMHGITPHAKVTYIALWFNSRGIERALAHANTLTLQGCIHFSASESFSRQNLNRDREANLSAVRALSTEHMKHDIPVSKISVMAAFGCNFQGRVTEQEVMQAVDDGHNVANDVGATITEIALADTMGWANPSLIRARVAAVRTRWPDTPIRLHLHDTRGLGIANACAALEQGVSRFDTTVGGLGGCPFAAHKGAPGNIATEELVLLAQELGIETGINLDALIEVGHRAEAIVGHQLPSAVLRGGSLSMKTDV